jgi:hypothetical protein
MNLTIDSVSDYLQKQGYNQAKVMTFLCWYKSSPSCWKEFQRIAIDLIQRGKKAGAIDIMAKIRWECEIEGGKDYKCNNNHAPMLARVFALKYPQYDFFNFREVGE